MTISLEPIPELSQCMIPSDMSLWILAWLSDARILHQTVYFQTFSVAPPSPTPLQVFTLAGCKDSGFPQTKWATLLFAIFWIHTWFQPYTQSAYFRFNIYNLVVQPICTLPNWWDSVWLRINNLLSSWFICNYFVSTGAIFLFATFAFVTLAMLLH